MNSHFDQGRVGMDKPLKLLKKVQKLESEVQREKENRPRPQWWWH